MTAHSLAADFAALEALQSAVNGTAGPLSRITPRLTALFEEVLTGAGSYAGLLESECGDFCLGNAQTIVSRGGEALAETGTTINRFVTLMQDADLSLSQAALTAIPAPGQEPTLGDDGLLLPPQANPTGDPRLAPPQLPPVEPLFLQPPGHTMVSDPRPVYGPLTATGTDIATPDRP